jgi:hypothetical protein
VKVSLTVALLAAVASPVIAAVPGMDGDGRTDLRDLNAFRERFVFDPAPPETDFNLDGVTNGYDLAILRAEILRRTTGTPCP